MNNRDSLNLGDEIKNIVQQALNNRDFNQLNRDIGNVTKDALDEVRRSIGWKQGIYINRSNKKPLIKPIKYTVPTGQVSGMLFTIFGSIGSVTFGIAVFVLALLGSIMGNLFYTIAIGLSPLLIISIILSIKGSSIRKRLKRFQKYISCMGNRSYCLIQDLSSSTGLSHKYIEKDLRKMIASGMFPEGHIDNKKTTFILTHECYKQYLEVQALEMKNQQAQIKKQVYEQEKEANNHHRLNPEMRKSLDAGRKFVLNIKEANIAIPGEEISLKLDRLEDITGKIFDYVEIHPDKFAEIRKFTEYFLPTTLKLVDAYRKLDDQTVQGENIASAKREIEETMDTINLAFENLLDDLFQDMAMDISTDISVLETMLAQEGLTGSNMRVQNKIMEDKE